MPAPEIGQAKTLEAQSATSGVIGEQSATHSSQTTEPPATLPGVPESASHGSPAGAPDEVPANAPSEAPASPNDGTVSLEELPDEDLQSLCVSQGISTPQDADRDQMIAALKAEGISRVTLSSGA